MSMFTKATKSAAKLRMSIDGISGSGKTYTALAVGSALAKAAGGRLCVVDTENNSASKYADIFDFDGLNMRGPFDPRKLIEVMKAAERENYGALVIDSLSHFWAGPGGVLEIVDNAAARSNSKNSFAAWREGTPVQNKLIEAIVQCQMHLICCMRSKAEYVTEKDERTGKVAPRKVGLAPVQRDQMEYEFDVVGSMNEQHQMVITKSRCPALDRAVIHLPGEYLATTLLGWLSDGEPAPVAPRADAPAPVNAQAQATEKPESARTKLLKVLMIWGQCKLTEKEKLIDLSRKACLLAKIDPESTIDEAAATACLLAVNNAIKEEVKPADVLEDELPADDLPAKTGKKAAKKSPSVKQMNAAPKRPKNLPEYVEPRTIEEATAIRTDWTNRYNAVENADQWDREASVYIDWCLRNVNDWINRNGAQDPRTGEVVGDPDPEPQEEEIPF
ncbi:AAA family ATPase [Tolypothrix sp. VBCCA 56010]|uniref:AAA family ATPase n=1 Tax=Tolypothrix sp. VBCCA 56010 TaxID=3137731 RepID=UPI003D7DCAD7